MNQKQIDTMSEALRRQGLTLNQTNFAVSLVRNAVTTERERAARVCDDEARIRTEAGEQHPEDSESRSRCFAAAKAAHQRSMNMGATLDLDDVSAEHQVARQKLEKLREDATCYRWMVANWGRILTDTCWDWVDNHRVVKSIELGPETLGRVEPESLHRAVLRAMSA